MEGLYRQLREKIVDVKDTILFAEVFSCIKGGA